MQYSATGKISIFGCSKTQKSIYYNYKYGENSIVFLRYKAIKGILERIAIKKVILQSGKQTFGQIIPLYQDTYNSLYNEKDLCTHQEAVELAILYYQNLENIATQAAKKC